MPQKIEADAWVYVLVENPEKDDQIVGQTDTENNISFIPMFLDRDSANRGVINLPREKGKKYEIQAIIFEDLERYAAQGEYVLLVLDDEGNVLDKRAPFQSLAP